MKYRQRPIDISMHSYFVAHIVIAAFIGRDLQLESLETHRVVIVDFAPMLLAKNIGQAAADERHIGCAW